MVFFNDLKLLKTCRNLVLNYERESKKHEFFTKTTIFWDQFDTKILFLIFKNLVFKEQ
jgi:hypothetical protein